ncbi:MAG: hypothetical protein ABIA93_01765 [Candidatus Woesearchaeota archaeon]
MTCWRCEGELVEKTAKTPDGVPYNYNHCSRCGENVLDMNQLHEVGEKYRLLRTQRVKLSSWGTSKGIRIPKDVIKKYGFKDEVSIIEEEGGIRIVP